MVSLVVTRPGSRLLVTAAISTDPVIVTGRDDKCVEDDCCCIRGGGIVMLLDIVWAGIEYEPPLASSDIPTGNTHV